MSGVLAIYGALVGTAALVWQIWSQVRRDRTILEVRVGAGWDGAPKSENHRLYTTVVNRSRHDVPMPAVMISQPSIGRHWPIHGDDVEQGLPGVLVARGSVLMTVPMSRFEGIDVKAPVAATAQTATGESFGSALSPLCWVND